MDPMLTAQLGRFKELYPDMDLEMVGFFAQTMMIFHHVPIMMEGYFKRLGLSKARFGVLIQLHPIEDPDGVSIGELLEYYKVSSATMTGVIDTLEGEGLIERVRSVRDRRKVHVRITAAGRAFMDEFLPAHQANIARFVSQLTTPEQETLMTLLGKLQSGIATALAEPEAAQAA